MFFSKKYQINIADPCHENWEGMTPTDKGRFCASCAKNVVDYSNMAEKQINEMIRSSSGNTCGRFRKEQLEKTYILHPKIQLSAQKRFFQYVLSILLASKGFINKAIGQTDTLKTEQTDSLKLTTIADTTIADTVALAEADTAKLHWDSLSISTEPTVICISDILYWDSLPPGITFIAGGMGIAYVDPRPQFPRALPIFEKVKKLIGIEKTDTKEITFEENKNPQKPKVPVKREEPIIAVLPEEIKSKTNKNLNT